MNKQIFFLVILGLLAFTSCKPKQEEKQAVVARWSEARAQQWGKKNGWLCGSNFNPSTAINQLETWQAESFDVATIDRELGWAEDLGMNVMRVYLHHVAWQVDKKGFKERINRYLEISEKHGVKTIFVFFDDCWNPVYAAGKQPDPKLGVHNSGWIQDPGNLLFTDATLIITLESYVKDILTTFKDDKRIILWDLYNEPGSSGNNSKSLPLLKKVFEWGLEVRPSQPLTSAPYTRTEVEKTHEIRKFQIEHSDIITYHNYDDAEKHQKVIDTLKKYNRPIICTEYMARKYKSLFTNVTPMLKKQNIGAINWGFVAGRSNTIYAWGDVIKDGSDPTLWFHDILYSNGKPYKQEEVDMIKSLTKK